MRPKVFWLTGLGLLGVCDIWASFNATEGDSLSEVIRDVYRVQTPEGKVAFLSSWALLSVWFVPHIVNKVKGS